MNILFRTETNDFISILHASNINDDGKVYRISGSCDIRSGTKIPMIVKINDSCAFNAYDIELDVKLYSRIKIAYDKGIADVNN